MHNHATRQSVLTYAAGKWVMSKRDKETLAVFERRVLRSILRGLKYVHRLKWAGHLIRLDDNRVTKYEYIFVARSPGTRKRSISPGLVETEFEYRCFADDLDTAKSIYESIKCMEPEDIVQAVLYVLGAPQRVEVHDILLRPLEQKV
ncbi:hypothetical protein TNCV_823221 [Trichonephila clavipes]|nr:hypothetical protein TNCV_823221 [Trichonephila clavipes]